MPLDAPTCVDWACRRHLKDRCEFSLIVIDESPGSLLLVRQPDHAETSAQIASAWRRPDAFSRASWAHFLQAVRHHDDGWYEAERTPTLDDDGRPHDFKSMDTKDHVNVWCRGLERAAEHDPYVALLVALHARWLYTHIEQDTAEQRGPAQAFVDQMTVRIDALIHHLSQGSAEQRNCVDPKNLSVARRLLTFFDAFSLALIGGITWFDRTERLAFGNCESNLSMTLDESSPQRNVGIAPWPLEAAHLEITTMAMKVHKVRFANACQLSAYMEMRAPTHIEWTFSPE